jgi:hypothetical protein
MNCKTEIIKWLNKGMDNLLKVFTEYPERLWIKTENGSFTIDVDHSENKVEINLSIYRDDGGPSADFYYEYNPSDEMAKFDTYLSLITRLATISIPIEKNEEPEQEYFIEKINEIWSELVEKIKNCPELNYDKELVCSLFEAFADAFDESEGCPRDEEELKEMYGDEYYIIGSITEIWERLGVLG